MKKRPLYRFAFIVLWILMTAWFAAVARGADFYGSVGGTGSACTFTAPCSFDTLITKLTVADQGWLRGGTYPGIHTLTSNVHIANYNATPGYGIGERVTLDPVTTTNGADKVVLFKGNNIVLDGVEMLYSWSGTRTSAQTGSNPTDLPFGYGFDCFQNGTLNYCQNVKLIDSYVHDVRGNGGSTLYAQNLELNGVILAYSGWSAPDRAHGHNIYLQSQVGPQKVLNSVIFGSSEYNIHAFGSANAALNGIDIENNGSARGGGGDFLIGGTPILNNVTIKGNVAADSYWNLGYCDPGAGFASGTITGNYLRGGLCLKPPYGTLSMTGNTFNLDFVHPDPGSQITSAFPNNSWNVCCYPNAPRPTANVVYVRPNAYKPGRARAFVFNWQGLVNVQIDMTGILAVGETYEVRNAQNFFGPLVATGTYAGGSITVPAGALPLAQPLGKPAVAPTGPDYNAFDIIRTGGAPPTATATATRTPTATVTRTSSATPTRTKTPTPASVCWTVTPACVMVTVTP